MSPLGVRAQQDGEQGQPQPGSSCLPSCSPSCARVARPWPRVLQMSENHPMGSILAIYRSLFSKISVGIGALLC